MSMVFSASIRTIITSMKAYTTRKRSSETHSKTFKYQLEISSSTIPSKREVQSLCLFNTISRYGIYHLKKLLLRGKVLTPVFYFFFSPLVVILPNNHWKESLCFCIVHRHIFKPRKYTFPKFESTIFTIARYSVFIYQIWPCLRFFSIGLFCIGFNLPFRKCWLSETIFRYFPSAYFKMGASVNDSSDWFRS